MKKPPVDHCLFDLDSISHGEKCEHNKGRWIVEWKGRLFVFDPPTQVQKDIWLNEMKAKGGEELHKKALESLRWLCNICGTVQQP